MQVSYCENSIILQSPWRGVRASAMSVKCRASIREPGAEGPARPDKAGCALDCLRRCSAPQAETYFHRRPRRAMATKAKGPGNPECRAPLDHAGEDRFSG